MKNRIEASGRTPLIFYLALLLPPIISYLELQLQHSSPEILLIKYGACFLIYLFCINLINNQKLIITENTLHLKINHYIFNIEKCIELSHINKIQNHDFLPSVKVIHHQGEKTLIVNLYRNKYLFEDIENERPDLFNS